MADLALIPQQQQQPLAAQLPPRQPQPQPQPRTMHKNQLQEFTQKSGIPLPEYKIMNEGFQHAPLFRASVVVDGQCYTSATTFTHRKAAEQDAARVALENLLQRVKDEGRPFIHKYLVFCKSILNEFAVKMGLEKPTYTTTSVSNGLLPVFTSTLVFNGTTYTGETGRSKKEAEQLAARTVLFSLLNDVNYEKDLSSIIKSKFKLFATMHLPDGKVIADNNVNRIENAGGTNGISTSKDGVDNGDNSMDKKPLHADNSLKHAVQVVSSEMQCLQHEFKPPNVEALPSTEAPSLPIAFVPSSSVQQDNFSEKSHKKRRKNRKKPNKRHRTNPQS